MPYKYGIKGADFLTIKGNFGIVLGYDKSQPYPIHALIYDTEIENYVSIWITEDSIKQWYIYWESTPRQKQQQDLFRLLGTIHRTKANLRHIAASLPQSATATEADKLINVFDRITLPYVNTLIKSIPK